MINSSLNKNKLFFLHAIPLFLVLFLDGMGLGLFIPILNALVFDANSHFFTQAITQTEQNFIFGATIGIFMLCWFFGATLLGDLSDQTGRKRTLFICLTGSFFSYLLSALAVVSHSITLLIAGRIIAGFTSGSQVIAQAAIIDLSSEKHKARNIGFILLSLSLGFVLGPLLGGVLSDTSLVSWFNFTVPLYFVCAVSLLNIILLVFCFKETRQIKHQAKIRPLHAIHLLIAGFKHEKIKYLSLIFFIFILGWSSFYSFISLFLLKIYAFTPTNISLFMAAMGGGFAIGNGFLVNFVSQRFSARQIIIGSLLAAASIGLLLITGNGPANAWLFIVPFTCCIAVAYSVLITAFSNQVDANSQGWVMGITGAIMAIVWALDATLVGMLAALNVYWPVVVCIICLSAAAVLMSFLKIESQKLNQSVSVI